MVVIKRRCEGSLRVELLDGSGAPIPIVSAFLGHLAARGCSPNTVLAYAHDLQHLWRFHAARSMTWDGMTPVESLGLLEHLRETPRRRHFRPLPGADGAATAAHLSPATINRILAAVSSFYDWTILAGRFDRPNPIQKVADRALVLISARHRPFLDGVGGGRTPMRRAVRVKAVLHLPRPLSAEQVATLMSVLRCARDRALVRLMLDGGLRPGEALGLHLVDIAYGRRRIVVRHREDHPRGVRAKSRTERVVDLHEPVTLEAISAYVMTERPAEAETPLVFLVGGSGRRRCEPLSYAALAKLFARACERAGIRGPGVTPHALRHTHATRMWEGGMRELTLQKRLGHASPESTRIYTRVSDLAVVAEYRRALGLTPPTGDGTP